MAEMLNPGVYVTEINASAIVPTVSNSVGVFGGDFVKGPVGVETLITNVGELLNIYGAPTNLNYNDFYQAYNFLQYGNKLLLSRASNVNGTATVITGESVTTAVVAASAVDGSISVTNGASFTVGDLISFDNAAGSADLLHVYSVVSITVNALLLDAIPAVDIATGSAVYSVQRSSNAIGEAISAGGVMATDAELFSTLMTIENASDYAMKEISMPFATTTGKLKFTTRNPGAWGNTVDVAIATPTAFGAATPSEAFPGIALDTLFEYAPTGTEVAIIIRENAVIMETWLVDLNPAAKDHNNKSTYIETVINGLSTYVFVKDNAANTVAVSDYCSSVNGSPGSNLALIFGTDSPIQADDLLNAYGIFDNKEVLDIDIVIANELDNGASAKTVVDARLDCIAFIGCNYADVVGQKATIATTNLVQWRKIGAVNYNSMFTVACANYKYQYDRYNDVYRWINVAGDIAGLRAATTTTRASWWASAGLERGQIKNVTRLAFNPTSGQRDMLYKNGLNPIVSFPGQGTVMWGQKTLLAKPSSFDRVNVRGLFNTLERALSKMAKYQIMEFNDNFTRNRIVSMIKPYLDSVQSGRGIQDFLVVCDESNNTPDVISRNQLIIDVYIKPTFVAEFIQLKFTNAGTNSFAQVIGA